MKIGDQVRFLNVKDGTIGKDLYKIIKIYDTYVKVKHPKIPGYFQFSKNKIAEVIPRI